MTSMFEGQPAKTRPKLQPKEGSWKGSRYDHSGELRFQFTATVSCLPKTRWIRFMQIPIVIYPKKSNWGDERSRNNWGENSYLQQRRFPPLAVCRYMNIQKSFKIRFFCREKSDLQLDFTSMICLTRNFEVHLSIGSSEHWRFPLCLHR